MAWRVALQHRGATPSDRRKARQGVDDTTPLIRLGQGDYERCIYPSDIDGKHARRGRRGHGAQTTAAAAGFSEKTMAQKLRSKLEALVDAYIEREAAWQKWVDAVSQLPESPLTSLKQTEFVVRRGGQWWHVEYSCGGWHVSNVEALP